EACTNPANLTRATQQTGLGLRTHQPQVYVVTSLAGGTGSGMFIDLAYVVRHLMHQNGFPHPSVVGLLVLPAADAQVSRTLALGNAYAALTELNHFSSPDLSATGGFAARYDERDRPITSTRPPFNRCLFLQAAGETRDGLAMAQLAGEYLCQELTSPLGPL